MLSSVFCGRPSRDSGGQASKKPEALSEDSTDVITSDEVPACKTVSGTGISVLGVVLRGAYQSPFLGDQASVVIAFDVQAGKDQTQVVLDGCNSHTRHRVHFFSLTNSKEFTHVRWCEIEMRAGR